MPAGEEFMSCDEDAMQGFMNVDDSESEDGPPNMESSSDEEVDEKAKDVDDSDSDSDFELDDFNMEESNFNKTKEVFEKVAHGVKLAMMSLIQMAREEHKDDQERGSVHDPRQQHCSINLLDSEYFIDINVAETLNYLNEFFGELFEVALDSGAGEHVADRKDAPNYVVEESAGSRAGQNFIAANNQRIPNQGQMTLALQCEGTNGKKGREIKTTFQVAKVSRPLWSVGRICDEGFGVKFMKDEALVLKKDGSIVCRFKRQGGLYVANMNLKNPLFKKSFQRQGAKA